MKEPVQDGDTAGRAAPGEQHRDGEFSAPLGSSRSGRLVFSSGASRITVSAAPSMAYLYRAHFAGRAPHVGVNDGTVTIRYPRFDWLYYLREPLGEVAINSQVPWDIEIRNGVSRLAASLRGLMLRSFDVRGGASRVELALPAPSGIVPVRVLGGASNVVIHRPEGVAAHVRVGGGSTNFAFDEQRFGAIGGELSLQSPGYDDTPDRYDITVAGGASCLTIGTR